MSKKLLFNFNREVIQNYTYVKYVGTIITATNTLEKPIKSAILKGSTKYRDIDTGEFLETFEEGRNLELVSVKMPVLTTSNEDGTKTNILSASEDVELRGIGEVRDTLDCLTGELTQRIGEIVLNGSENYLVHKTGDEFMRFKLTMGYSDVKKWGKSISNNFAYNRQILDSSNDLEICNGDGAHEAFLFNIHKSRLSTNDVTGFKNWLSQNNTIIHYELSNNTVKTVDLSILDQNENKVSSISSFNDTTHIAASSETIPPIFEGYLATKEVE